ALGACVPRAGAWGLCRAFGPVALCRPFGAPEIRIATTRTASRRHQERFRPTSLMCGIRRARKAQTLPTLPPPRGEGEPGRVVGMVPGAIIPGRCALLPDHFFRGATCHLPRDRWVPSCHVAGGRSSASHPAAHRAVGVAVEADGAEG